MKENFKIQALEQFEDLKVHWENDIRLFLKKFDKNNETETPDEVQNSQRFL